MEAKRIKDIAGREGILLSNGLIRVVIEDYGGMTPELSYKNEETYVNTHFIPHFRGSSCQYDEKLHSKWGGKLAHELAGTWPCFPNFGNASENRKDKVPVCGHTANEIWEVKDFGVKDGFCYQVSKMGGQHTANIHYTKYDILLENDSVYYQVIKVKNLSNETYYFGGALHNTCGSTFVEKGGIISACADLYHTPPVSHDPSQNERLELNKIFTSLKEAPKKDGGEIDISVIPGLIGYTDFITGRIPKNIDLGWMGIVNPNLESLYLTFFNGPKKIVENEFTFYFNHIWFQYGGRNYLPWSKYEGGVDQTLAVGIESAISAWGYGLDYCDKNPTLMGNPTIIPLEAQEEKLLFHGTLVKKINAKFLNTGIQKVTRDTEGLHISNEDDDVLDIKTDAHFNKIKEIIKII